MMPPLKQVRAGLRRTTETLATELAAGPPGGLTPLWSEFDWQLARAVAVAHGVSPLLAGYDSWLHTGWRRFLAGQFAHVAQRHERIASILDRLEGAAWDAGVSIVPLKGAALHALGLYAAGQRPMSDIDILVRPEDGDATASLLLRMGYCESFASWKHRVFKPLAGEARSGLGEHRDTPVNIELHTHIHERLPVATVDLTRRISPVMPRPGLHAYPSHGALMNHLLLHAAGNICSRSLRLIHLNDIALLAARMHLGDWETLWADDGAGPPWWALPPLRMVRRYYPLAVPPCVMTRLERACPLMLRDASRHWTLTDVSCSALWLQALPGVEWSRSLVDVGRCVGRRLRPDRDTLQERADLVRSQVWLQGPGQSWVTQSQWRRFFVRLTRPVPRMDTMYVVRETLAAPLY